MFISHPQHESILLTSLSTRGAQYWRSMQISANKPWFVLTVEVAHDGQTRHRSICIAWDSDLVHTIESLVDVKPVGLLCMTPNRASNSPRWLSRAVQEVWIAQTKAMEQIVVLCDEHGAELGDHLGRMPSHSSRARRLLIAFERHEAAEPSASPVVSCAESA